jgi:hypothetical protein
MQLKPLEEISLNVLGKPESAPPILEPDSLPLEVGRQTRGFSEQLFEWRASGLSHYPLYFEDVALERYGQTRCLQPAWSGVRFFGAVPLLPYKMGLDCPHERIYTLGYARPGDAAPPVRERLPFSLKGLAAEAAAAAGFVSLFP